MMRLYLCLSDRENDMTAKIETAHDVRHLCPCRHCDQIGDDREMVLSEFHPGCFAKQFGEAAIFNLAGEDRKKFRLCDVTPDTMRRLLEAS